MIKVFRVPFKSDALKIRAPIRKFSLDVSNTGAQKKDPISENKTEGLK